MKWYEPQPAYLIYAYDGGWQVINYVTKHVFTRTATEARSWSSTAEPWRLKAQYEDNQVLKYWYWSIYVGYQLAGLSQYVAAFLFVTVFVVLHFILLISWVTVTSVIIAILAAMNFLYSTYLQIFFRCPDCHEQMVLPIYACPSCATEHTRLWPSIYGVLHHRCSKCNTLLPTLDLNGRKNLVQKCAVCKRPMNKEIGRLVNIHIPVIGGPSAGKSNYIFMATRAFIEDYATPRRFDVTFPDEKHEQGYKENVRTLMNGQPLPKTPDVVPQAYNLAIRRSRNPIGRIVYIYDAAGEAYNTEDNVVLQTYYKYVHGLIFVIDPFSIEMFSRQHKLALDPLRATIRPSPLRVMDAYERMLTVLESSVGLQRGKKFPHPIAVVISKTDALDLETHIGHPAAQELIRNTPSMLLEQDAIHILVKKFLLDNELGNFVRDLDLQFEQVGFFSCSALGRLPSTGDASPYQPLRVLDPLIWILGQVGVTPVRQERVRFVDIQHKLLARQQANFLRAAKYYYWDSLKPRKV